MKNKKRRFFTFQRKIILGLFLVLLQLIPVNVYKNEVTTELLEPERDILQIQMGDAIISSVLPYRETNEVSSIQSYTCLIRKQMEICSLRHDIIRNGLGIPMKTKGLIAIPLVPSSAERYFFQNSAILMAVREHALLPMTRKLIGVTAVPAEYKIQKSYARYHYESVRSKEERKEGWEMLVDALRTPKVEASLGHRVLLSDGGDTVAVGLDHVGYTVQLTAILMFTTVAILISEVIIFRVRA